MTKDFNLENIPTFELPYTNAKIPVIGFGSGSKHRLKKWGSEINENDIDMDIVNVIVNAIRAGHRHLDGAETYTTRKEMAKAVEICGVPREKLWITDKYDQGWPNFQRASTSPSGPRESIEKGLKVFNIEYFDLFLIHSQFFKEDLVDVSITEAWKQLEECYEQGLVKNIGVSNFDVEHLSYIMKIAKHKPQVLQIEYHPYLQNQTPGIFEYCQKNSINIQAYCPLTPALDSRIEDANHPLKSVLQQLAQKYGVAPSTIVLKWIIQSGVIPITTSSNFERMKQSFDILNFNLTEQEFEDIKGIGNSYKVRAYFKELFDDKLYDENIFI